MDLNLVVQRHDETEWCDLYQLEALAGSPVMVKHLARELLVVNNNVLTISSVVFDVTRKVCRLTVRRGDFSQSGD